MKLYLFDTINRFKRYSETLDVKTKICNRPWIVFNDGGEKEVYKFKEDGTINIVLSGRVTRGTWEYDPTDKTIIVSASDQSYMVHPGMYDDMLLVLQVDGTNECIFLVEQNNSQHFEPQSYKELMQYFEDKEKKEIEKVDEIRKKKEAEIIARRQKEIQEDKIIDNFRLFLNEKQFKEHSPQTDNNVKGCFGAIAIISFLISILLIIVIFFINRTDIRNYIEKGSSFSLMIFVLSLIMYFLYNVYVLVKCIILHFVDKIRYKKILNEFINQSQNKYSIDDDIKAKLWTFFNSTSQKMIDVL